MSSQIYNAGGQIVTPDIYFQIGMNMIPGMGSFFASGINPTVRSDWETVWPTGGLYPWPSVASTIQIYSGDPEDNASGNGARTVEVSGLGSDWTERIETVILDGLTGVDTINQFLRVNSVRVTSVGSNNSNIGIIYADHSVEGTLQTIPVGYNRSQAAVISSPAGFNVGLLGYYASLFAPSQVSLAEAAFLAHKENEPYNVLISEILPNPSDTDINPKVPYFLPEKTDLEIITITDIGNRDSTISAGFSGVYIDQGYSI